MSPFIILFEDHACVDFRPLAWSQPVYELRCGLFSLRERVALLGAGGGGNPRMGLLTRDLLLPLQEATLPTGCVAGAQACREGAAGGALFLNARLGPGWGTLAALLAAAAEPDWAWREGEDLLACRLGPPAAREFLAQWQAWEAAAAARGCWRASGLRPAPFLPAAGCTPRTPDAGGALRHVWDLVPAQGPAIAADCARIVTGGHGVARHPFGVVPEPAAWPGGPPWSAPAHFLPWSAATFPGAHAEGEVWVADNASVAPGVVLSATAGPIVLDRGARVQPQAYLEGPLYVGPGALVKAGARVYGETSIGAVCRVAGEIGESLFLDFGNKQHDGFIGHAALGSWVNLGAGTTCSDLKNNYGPVRADLGLGPCDTGLRFLGLLMGDHAKSAIGTLFNTATVVGFASNVFGSGFPPKHLPNFTWGAPDGPPYDAGRAAEVARVVMGRRGCRFLPAHGKLFQALARAA